MSISRLKNRLRKILFSNVNNSTRKKFYYIYYTLRYPKAKSKKCSFGDNNPDITFYVVRPRTDCVEGLMSLFMYVVKHIHYAYQQGYVPIVDFKNYKTQYQDSSYIDSNVWDMFFTQPTQYTLDEVYSSKNVILSGWDIPYNQSPLYQINFEESQLKKVREDIFSKIDFSDNVKEKLQIELEKTELNYSKTLALYLRGTDYTALKPAGHPIQPTVHQAVEVVDEFVKKYDIEKIFLVTEDGTIYKQIKERYGNMCATVSYDSFINDYDGKNYLSQDKSISEVGETPYIRGMNYLVKLIILSQCPYFVGGNTMGSWATCIFSAEKCISKHVFDLGMYGK